MAQVTVNIDKLRHNIQFLVAFCRRLGLGITGIIKGPGLEPIIIREFMANGIDNIGFSNLPVRHTYEKVLRKKPVFISLPSTHHIRRMVHYYGTSFNSEISVIKKINEVLVADQSTHDILLMVDTGDLREGVLPENVLETVRQIHEIKNLRIRFSGIGSNLGCCAGIVPNEQNINVLQDLAIQVETRLGIAVNTVSIGGSVVLNWLENHRLPDKFNRVRMGEAIFLGHIPTIGEKHTGLHDDVLVFKGDVLEAKEKNIRQPEQLGMDAFGRKAEFRYRGIRKRAILNFGYSDTSPGGLEPLENGLKIISVNSNYTVLDFTDYRRELKPGDVVAFKMSYISMLQSFVSPFTRIVYQTDEKGRKETWD